MLRIGLTGGIGSGKTTVVRVFETLGIPVYYADEATKELMNTDPALKEAIMQTFGKEAYKQGRLDRKYLAAIVFKDKEKLAILNSLTHPATIADAEKWMSRQTTPYCIKEAALLIESGAARLMDYTVGVFAPQPLRIQRVMQRDKVTAEEVLRRLGNQLDEEKKMKECDFVISNDEQKLLIPQVLELHDKFMAGNAENSN